MSSRQCAASSLAARYTSRATAISTSRSSAAAAPGRTKRKSSGTTLGADPAEREGPREAAGLVVSGELSDGAEGVAGHVLGLLAGHVQHERDLVGAEPVVAPGGED